jgi:hypothetical protein
MKIEQNTNEDACVGLGAWDGVERREMLAHLGGMFAIRRFVAWSPMTEGAAYGTEMVERRKLPDRRTLNLNEARNHEQH